MVAYGKYADDATLRGSALQPHARLSFPPCWSGHVSWLLEKQESKSEFALLLGWSLSL